MSASSESTILIPIDISGDDSPTTDIIDLMGPLNTVLLGYYPVPNQAAPAQIKHDKESDAAERLAGLSTSLREAGHTVTDVLVFTHDRQDTIDRIAEEHDCDAILSPGAGGTIDTIVVPLKGPENIERILALVSDLMQTGDASVTLYHSTMGDTSGQAGESLLEEAANRLRSSGIDRDRIRTHLSEREAPSADIIDLAGEFDVIVLGETEPSLRERILGEIPTGAIDDTSTPVVVVRNPEEPANE